MDGRLDRYVLFLVGIRYVYFFCDGFPCRPLSRGGLVEVQYGAIGYA